jgi:hypothetical protein
MIDIKEQGSKKSILQKCRFIIISKRSNCKLKFDKNLFN